MVTVRSHSSRPCSHETSNLGEPLSISRSSAQPDGMKESQTVQAAMRALAEEASPAGRDGLAQRTGWTLPAEEAHGVFPTKRHPLSEAAVTQQGWVQAVAEPQ